MTRRSLALLIMSLAPLPSCDSKEPGAADLAPCLDCADLGLDPPSTDAATDLPATPCADPLAASDCPTAALPLCGAAGICQACADPLDDARCQLKSAAAPRCKDTAPLLGQCVQCRPATQATDCTSATPICGANGSCRACGAHTECPSGLCLHDGSTAGQCAPQSMVSYVDNSFASCAAGNGSRSNPVCEISTAVALGLPFISVKGSPTPYAAITLTSGSLTVVGPGRQSSPTAKIAPAASPAALVNTTGTPATLILDGLELTGSGGGTPSPAVKCTFNTGAATIVVRNSLLRMSGGAGLDANACSATLNSNVISGNQGGGVSLSGSSSYSASLNSNVISGNQGGGVSLSGSSSYSASLNSNIISGNQGGGVSLSGSSSYTATNNIIAANGNAGPGVTLSGGASGTFAFNTVAGNTVTAGISGIDCGGGGVKPLQFTIVTSNASTNGGPQIGGNCSMTGVVTAGPEFASVSDFHLAAGSAANVSCCVDKVANPSTPNASLDVDGTARPKGAAHDIGAHELQ